MKSFIQLGFCIQFNHERSLDGLHASLAHISNGLASLTRRPSKVLGHHPQRDVVRTHPYPQYE